MTESTAKKDVPEIGNAPQMIDAAMVPLELIQDILDVLRDVSMPHKVSNPLINKLQQAPVGKFPLDQLLAKVK